jgi:hypothetical protein
VVKDRRHINETAILSRFHAAVQRLMQ